MRGGDEGSQCWEASVDWGLFEIVAQKEEGYFGPDYWVAFRDGYEPDSKVPMGYGKTREEAIEDLIDQESME